MDLISVFPILHNYVVVKLDDKIPEYKVNDDIDILTDDIVKNINIIIDWYDKSLFYHKITKLNENHIHLDLFKQNQYSLHFRFDIFDKLIFTKFSIDQDICRMILKNKIENNKHIFVPCLKDDLSLRYCEYIEYIERRSDKIKHLNYVNKFDTPFYKIVPGEKLSKLNYVDYSPSYTNVIVWGHGIPFVTDILKTLHEDIDCDILNVTKHNYENIDDIIQRCYKLEMKNYNHIAVKTQYLKNVDKSIMFILLKNYGNQYKQYGTGTFAVTADKNMVDWKWKIREKYNPRQNGIDLKPLPKGISHNHVIHVTDDGKESEYLTQEFLKKPPEYFESKIIQLKQGCLCVPWHIRNPKIVNISFVDIHELNVNIVGKTHCKLEDTPHYKYVSGNKEIYKTYYTKYIGEYLQDNHTCQQYDILINRFNAHQYNNESKHLIIIDKSNTVLDGLHRLSILKYNGIQKVKVAQLLY